MIFWSILDHFGDRFFQKAPIIKKAPPFTPKSGKGGGFLNWNTPDPSRNRYTMKPMVDIRGYKFWEGDINFRPKFIFGDPKIYVHVRQSLNYGQFGSGFAFI